MREATGRDVPSQGTGSIRLSSARTCRAGEGNGGVTISVRRGVVDRMYLVSNHVEAWSLTKLGAPGERTGRAIRSRLDSAADHRRKSAPFTSR